MSIKEKILKDLQAGPVKYKKLQSRYKATKKFFTAMEELYNEGKITERNGYIHLVVQKEKKKNTDPSLMAGTVVKLTENFGFVRVPQLEKDVFVSGKYMMGAVPGDEVLVKRVRSVSRDFEGEIKDITKEKTNLVGVVTNVGRYISVQLKDCQYVTMKAENKAPVVIDDIVLIDVTNRGSSHSRLGCIITEVVGKVSSSQKAVQVLLAEKNVQTAFPQSVISEARKVIANTDLQAEFEKRTDLRHMPIFTIDSASTKDIDDAISVEKTVKGYKLGVHIADVSFYVRGSSEVDKNAFERGTSIYYGDSVIPMLPKEYSNDVCSLNENSDRLAFSCFIWLDSTGNITNYKFEKTVIRSRVKGVYSEINSVLAGDVSDEMKEKYSQVWSQLFVAKELFDLLRKKRVERGSMDIESDEAYIIFDSKGKAVDIRKRRRGLSEMIIEEFMLCANSCAANLGRKHKLPFVYRTHQEPDAEKLYTLKENLGRIGLSLSRDKNKTLQQSMSELLDKTRGTNLQNVVHKQILRSQSKAKYSPDPLGHFGIVLEDYAHFTSPIRRYADLAIHRILSEYVAGANMEKMSKRFGKFAPNRAQQASNTEIVAMNVERDATDIYKAEIMADHIGEVFTGTVSGVMSYGIYVVLDNTVEGLVHISLLDMFNPVLNEGYSLSCSITGETFRIGDTVSVKVIGTDILNGNVDFAMADTEIIENTAKTQPKQRKSSEKRFEKQKGKKSPKKTKYKRR
ncbi:MAG: ribonuclease R [Oscillospiraceae bacterium]|nr:ribonuclease R [Oscillospiraceae bacterium]